MGATNDAGRTGRVEVRLLGGFALLDDGREVDVLPGTHRLLALLALRRRLLDRALVAGTLWPDTTDAKAAANLRNAIWRLRQLHVDVVRVTPLRVGLLPAVTVDVHQLEELAADLLSAAPNDHTATFVLDRLRGELFPECWDSWLVLERERVRQLSLQTLEALGGQLLAAGAPQHAVLVAMAAVELEPLRESANAVLMRAHLASGNRSEAVRQFHRYSALLGEELGIEVSVELAGLVGLPPATVPTRR